MSYELRWVAPEGAHDQSSYDVVKDGKVVGGAMSREDAECIRTNMAAKETNETVTEEWTSLLDEYENNDNKTNNKNQKVNTQPKQKTASVAVVGAYLNDESYFIETEKNTNEARPEIKVLTLCGEQFENDEIFIAGIEYELFDLQDNNKNNPFNYVHAGRAAKWIAIEELRGPRVFVKEVEKNWDQNEEFDDVLSETTLTIYVKAFFN